MIHPTSLYQNAIALLEDGTPVTFLGWTIWTTFESANATARVRLPSGEVVYRHSRDLNPVTAGRERDPLTMPGARACAIGFGGVTR